MLKILHENQYFPGNDDWGKHLIDSSVEHDQHHLRSLVQLKKVSIKDEKASQICFPNLETIWDLTPCGAAVAPR